MVAHEEFWQSFEDSAALAPLLDPPYRDRFPATMPDGRRLVQPLRQLPSEAETAVASLISTQASFEVGRALIGWMTELARDLESDVVVGTPTLGLLYAYGVAERLGMPNWVALGYSRKFWYDDALSEPGTSITSPDALKRLYLDPRMLGRLRGRRVLLVDDVLSTGTTAAAAMAVLLRAEIQVVGMLFAMLQGNRWQARLAGLGPEWPARVSGVYATPLFGRSEDGWYPRLETLAPASALLETRLL